jgi:hypothetical protein
MISPEMGSSNVKASVAVKGGESVKPSVGLISSEAIDFTPTLVQKLRPPPNPGEVGDVISPMFQATHAAAAAAPKAGLQTRRPEGNVVKVGERLGLRRVRHQGGLASLVNA